MPLTDLLKTAAGKRPDNTALKDGKHGITYGQLEDLSGSIAASLMSRGVRPGDRVGIYLNRSVEAIACVFGILKTGAAYVPIDIMLPPQRISYILMDCSIKILIADSKKAPLVTDDVEVITVNELKSGSPFKKIPPVPDDALANILYTSGSTGEPKGVMMSHRALIASASGICGYYRLTQEDRISSTVPLHFSMSVFEIFATALARAALYLVPTGAFAFPSTLSDIIERERLTVWHSVPSAITQMVLYGNVGKRDFSSLRLLHLGGGMIPVEHLRAFMEMVPHASYYNVYGSAETHEIAAYHIKEVPETITNVPIGKPWPGAEIYLADGSGELYARTPSLMDGYWNDDEKTKETLVDSPLHPPEKGIKFYKTNDTAIIDRDGNYLLTGRCDDTVKRDGYRIGLAEIEAALFVSPEVKEAAVIATAGGKIRALVVPGGRRPLSEEDIRRIFRERLPNYMMPDEIEFRTELAKTLSGKIDRRRLQGGGP